MPDRLSPLDRSFLQVQTATAHMQVSPPTRLRFAPPPGGAPITLARVRALVASRLHCSGRFRQRLALPPGGLGGGRWVDDEAFDLRAHVVALAGALAESADELLAAARTRKPRTVAA